MESEKNLWTNSSLHYTDVIMGTIASQITSFTIGYSAVYSDAHQRKYQSSASLVFVWGIHRRPVNSPHKWPVTRKMFPFDDVIMYLSIIALSLTHKEQIMHRAIIIIVTIVVILMFIITTSDTLPFQLYSGYFFLSKTLATGTPWLVRGGELWGVFCEFSVWWLLV